MKRHLPHLLDRPARVLIVDDERYNRQLLEVMLSSAGYQIQMASGGREALAMIAAERPDLILLDVMMPDMDGYQVAADVKANPLTWNIPIILVTALDDRDERIRGLTAGAEDFLTKPVDRVELSTRVRNLLRLKAYGDHFDQQAQSLEAQVEARTDELRRARDRATAAVEALQLATERTQYALEISNVGIWDLDVLTGAMRLSPILESQYGFAPGEFGGTFEAFLERVHPDDQLAVRTAITAAAMAGTDFTIDNRSTLPDGTSRWLHNTGRFQLKNQGAPGRGVGISQDVTERRILEAQHLQASKMEAIGQLASGVAHDFNNLLTVINGFTELVGESVETGSQSAGDLEEITKAANRAADLTRQLLVFSRQQVVDTAPLDLNALITDMTRMLNRLIGADIEVTLTLAPGLALAQADRGQLEQVIMNLVVNARDAMPEGGRLTIETANAELENSPFHAETVMAGAYVMLSVSDEGTGMTKETQRRLFEPFYTTKEVGKGTGLGLSTTYGIVKQSKGHIWVYSELGEGTTFNVYLPRAAGAPVAVADPLAAAPPVQSPSETVLLVEDEPGVRGLGRRILQKAGYRVLEADNGSDGERMFHRHADAIDIVVTDVVMPGCSGPELIRRLREGQPDLRVLYMSGYSEQSLTRLTGLDRHPAIVQKPFTAAKFLSQVREALQQ